MTLHQSRMKKETLDAMLSAMKDYMPIFHKYLRRKAEVMGYKNGLPGMNYSHQWEKQTRNLQLKQRLFNQSLFSICQRYGRYDETGI